MKISLNWLNQYVKINLPPDKLAVKLTNAGLEVESIEYLGEKYKNFVIGKVLGVPKHPNADKLTVCDVDIVAQNLKIVCGAPNVAVGQHVVVGLVGATIPKNQHDPEGKPFTLTKAKIRGVESNGMICSEYELDIGEDKDGIYILGNDTQIGQAFADFLGLNDVVFEVGITPNRPDCLSHIGIAREVAALLKKQLMVPSIKFKEDKELVSKNASVVIKDSNNCPRYSARVIKNIKIGPSPKWLQNRLSAVGIRPINNVVDVTNYVLMETGHPLHAFDYDKLESHTIIVRTASDGEYFTTLDEKGRELKENTLLICDAEKPVAIAGVMGGLNSEISESTQNILIESAYFNPSNIRRSSKYIGLNTNASQRFERGADPNITVYALDRCTQLISKIAGGKILKGVLDVYPKKFKPVKIKVRLSKVNSILGTNLSSEEVKSLLGRIGIQLKNILKKKDKDSVLLYEVPTFRPDIEREIDVIEEVARLYGYDRIETKTTSYIKFSSQTPKIEFNDELRQWLAGRGFNEVITNSLLSQEVASLTSENVVILKNPLSREMNAMRTSLIPSMLEIVRNNINRQEKNLNLFEIGRVYFSVDETEMSTLVTGYSEEERLILVKCGQSDFLNWSVHERKSDIFDIKGVIEDIFLKILLDKYKFIPYHATKALVDSAISIEIQNIEVGYLGKINDEILKKYSIEQDVYVAELSVDRLKQLYQSDKKYKSLPTFPSVIRDLAFVVEANISFAELSETIKSLGGGLVKSVELFDLYTGNQIDKNKKSFAFTIKFLSEEKTLTDEEVEVVIEKIINGMNSKHGAEIRK
ncbi:MAG: phenylalanine--tRNA ligase subunit beta [Bacteroidetes bacterium]|nr:phenylalanine--tRNA ligase subunit beta [Bacteroidota bacterium]